MTDTKQLKEIKRLKALVEQLTSTQVIYSVEQQQVAINDELRAEIEQIRSDYLVAEAEADINCGLILKYRLQIDELQEQINRLTIDSKTEAELKFEITGYKAQVAGQAKYIECLLAEIRELNERIQEFVK